MERGGGGSFGGGGVGGLLVRGVVCRGLDPEELDPRRNVWWAGNSALDVECRDGVEDVYMRKRRKETKKEKYGMLMCMRFVDTRKAVYFCFFLVKYFLNLLLTFLVLLLFRSGFRCLWSCNI